MQKKIFKNLLFSFIVLFIFTYSVGQVFAKIYDTDIVATITPGSPRPNDTVDISLETYSTDLNRDVITWKVDGKIIKKGIAVKTFTTKVGVVGKTTNVEVDIDDPNGQSVKKTILLSPTQIDLLWQANSYVPPFYKGKALYPHQGEITFIATPTFISGGKKIDPDNLIYKWTNDGTVLGSLSGYGKKTLSITGSVISKPLKIQVDVTTLDGKVSGSQSITVSPIRPFVLFYTNSPLYGVMYENTIPDNFIMDNKEISIFAAPYYFDKRDNNSDFNYKWSVNGDIISGNTNTKTFRINDNTSGTSEISLHLENISKILQSANKNLTIQFNGSTN